MKIVKLDRRFKQYQTGHVVALRFPSMNSKSITIEKLCKDRLGGHGRDRSGDWCSYFGARNGHSDRRTYWIAFRRESDLTMVLLSADLTQNA